MTVLFLSDLWQSFPGGAERLAFNMARHLMRSGMDVRVLTGYGPAVQLDGPPVDIREDIGVFKDRDAGAEIVAAYLEQLQPDVIVTHHLYANQFAPELIAYGRPFVQVVLNGERIPEAAWAVHISDWVRARAGGRDEDLTLLPWAEQDVDATTHERAVGFIKPIEHKGVELVYDVAVSMPDRRFVILRGEWQTLELMPSDLDFPELTNVEFMEPVADMRDFYRRVDRVLMPSRSEDAGTVAQECAVNRIPCISSNVDGLAETNAGGVKLDCDDVAGFRRWIEALDTPALYDRMVARQLAGYRAMEHDRKLALFTARIADLH